MNQLNLFPQQSTPAQTQSFAPTEDLLNSLRPDFSKQNQKQQESLSASTNCGDSDSDSLSSTPIKNALNSQLSLQKAISTNFSGKRIQQSLQLQTQQSLQLNQQPSTQMIHTRQQENYKTEICRNWKIGKCLYDKKCRYAHGEEEKSNKSNVSEFYKTRECKLFHQEGYCSYGIRCHFIHVNKNLTDIKKNSQMTYSKMLNQGIIRNPAKSSRFSDIFAEEDSSDASSQTSSTIQLPCYFEEQQQEQQQFYNGQQSFQQYSYEQQQQIYYQQQQQQMCFVQAN